MTSLDVPGAALSTAADQLERQLELSLSFLRSIDEDTTLRPYAPGKWTIKEVLGHVTDLERIFGFRAFCFARGDNGPLPSVDCDAYLIEGRFNERPFTELIREFATVRAGTVALLRSLPAGVWSRSGVASGTTYSVADLVEDLVGHERHHMRIIGERYLRDPPRAAPFYPAFEL